MTARQSAETAVSQSEAHQQAGQINDEKAIAGKELAGKEALDGNIQVSTLDKNAIYDPKQESLLTRLGLNMESFKRAPGTTAGHVGASTTRWRKGVRLKIFP